MDWGVLFYIYVVGSKVKMSQLHIIVGCHCKVKFPIAKDLSITWNAPPKFIITLTLQEKIYHARKSDNSYRLVFRWKWITTRDKRKTYLCVPWTCCFNFFSVPATTCNPDIFSFTVLSLHVIWTAEDNTVFHLDTRS